MRSSGRRSSPWIALILAGGLAPISASAAMDFEATEATFNMDAYECGDLEPSGRMTAHFIYHGIDAYRGGTSILVFQDLDGDQRATAADVSIARVDIPVGTLFPPGRRASGVAMLLGHLPFPELPVWFTVDPDNLVAETDETNNTHLAGHPCAADAAHLVPLADLSLAITSVDVILAGAPTCSAVALVAARAANLGALDPQADVTVRGYADLIAPDSAAVTFRAPAPGEIVDFVIEVPFSGSTTLIIALDDDGSGTGSGFIEECQEGNNSCWIPVDSGAVPPSLAAPLGPALRATAHGDPQAALITGDFNWLLDAGAPRPGGDSFLVFESVRPDRLDPVEIFPPLRVPRWTSVTTRGMRDPTVHFILIVPADECGRPQP